MLILSRKTEESIVIGENIRITVVSIRGRYVRIGIQAPGDIGIYREELCLERASTPALKMDQARHHRRPPASIGGHADERETSLNA